jgi:hypothetical protein
MQGLAMKIAWLSFIFSGRPVSYLIDSFRSLPGLKYGRFDAGIGNSSFVLGFRPTRAFRSLTPKAPKPVITTFSLFFKLD